MMGEYAEMMLDGMVCQWCGEFLGEGDGYPVACAGCQSAEGVNQNGQKAPAYKPFICEHGKAPGFTGCTRRFQTEQACEQHRRDKHRGE
jgi:hypothetical protein